MTIYVDKNKHCHIVQSNGLREIETDYFDGKCTEFIEGYCYDDSAGYISIYPWKPFDELKKSQDQYENEQLKNQVSDVENRTETLESTTDDMILLMAELIGGE